MSDSVTTTDVISVLSLDVLKVVFTGIISVASIAIAFLVYRLRRREPWGRALFEIVKLMETPEMRTIRRGVIYACARNEHGEWTAPDHDSSQTRAAFDTWGAYLDMISLLYFSRQLNRVLFFEMYGDVIIRSMYMLSSYANEQRISRGEQFWLPYQLLVSDILRVWKKRAKQKLYPPRIGFVERPDVLTVDSLRQNPEVRRFLTANGRGYI